MHARLIAEYDLDDPVIPSADGRVMDGMHRICRALVEGRESVLAVRFEKDPEPVLMEAAEYLSDTCSRRAAAALAEMCYLQ